MVVLSAIEYGITITTGKVKVNENTDVSFPECYLDMLCTAFPTGISPEYIPDPARQTPEGSRVVPDSDELTVILEPVSFEGSTPEFCVCTRNKGDSMISVHSANLL